MPKAIKDSVGIDYQGFGTAGNAVNMVKRGNPIFILVRWGAGGGHFVVVDTVYNMGGQLYAAVCDPWDGNVHLTNHSTTREGRRYLTWDSAALITNIQLKVVGLFMAG